MQEKLGSEKREESYQLLLLLWICFCVFMLSSLLRENHSSWSNQSKVCVHSFYTHFLILFIFSLLFLFLSVSVFLSFSAKKPIIKKILSWINGTFWMLKQQLKSLLFIKGRLWIAQPQIFFFFLGFLAALCPFRDFENKTLSS